MRTTFAATSEVALKNPAATADVLHGDVPTHDEKVTISMMRSSRWKKRAAVLAMGLAAAAVVPAVAGPSVSAQTTPSIGAGGEFFPVTPARLLNTRNPQNDVAPLGAKPTNANGQSFNLKVTGRDGVPEDNVLAVAVNVVVIQPDGPGFLSMRPAGSSGDEITSLVNFSRAGEFVPNLGIVGVGTNGEVEIEVTTPTVSGDVDIIVDIYGWVATSGYDDAEDNGARVRTLTPARFMDTRNANQLPPALSSPRQLRSDESVKLPIRGVGSVPNSTDVTGVIVNLTGVFPDGGTFLALTPERPTGTVATSNGNYLPGEVRANMAIVPLGSDGSISITNGPGEIDAVIDVLGYVERGADESTDAGRVVPLEAPFRSFNTQLAEFGSVRLGPSQWEDWSFSKFSDSVELDGVTNIPQQGFFANLVGFDLQNSNGTFLALNPREPQPFSDGPDNSSLNMLGGQLAANNMTLVRYGDNGDGDDAVVSAFNATGSIHYHLDIYAVILDD